MLNRERGLINFPPLKRGGLFERGGGLIEDLWYTLLHYSHIPNTKLNYLRKTFLKRSLESFAFGLG